MINRDGQKGYGPTVARGVCVGIEELHVYLYLWQPWTTPFQVSDCLWKVGVGWGGGGRGGGKDLPPGGERPTGVGIEEPSLVAVGNTIPGV